MYMYKYSDSSCKILYNWFIFTGYPGNTEAANREKLKENTVFVKSLPKDLTSKELHDKLEE